MLKINRLDKSRNIFSPRVIWLTFFIFVNLVGMFFILVSGRFLGDTAGVELIAYDMVLPMSIVVIFSYIGILGVAFPLMSKIKIKPVTGLIRTNDKSFGYVLFLHQLAFIWFFTSTGTFVAGSTARSESVWTVYWVLLNVDVLFFIYYGFFRESQLFVPNLIIAIISSLLRGWSGIFIVIIFMETARLIRAGRLSLSKILLASFFVVLGYPLIYMVKLQIRLASLSSELNSNIFSFSPSNIGYENFFSLLVASLLQIFERLQLVSSQLVVYQNISELGSKLSDGKILPFWLEGIHGLAYERILGLEPVSNLGVSLANLIDPVQTEINWNANPGYASWLFLSPFLTPFYIFYTLGLIFFAVLLVKHMSAKICAMDMLWFACLVYVIPGWLASFVLFVYSIIIFYLFHFFVNVVFRKTYFRDQ